MRNFIGFHHEQNYDNDSLFFKFEQNNPNSIIHWTSFKTVNIIAKPGPTELCSRFYKCL